MNNKIITNLQRHINDCEALLNSRNLVDGIDQFLKEFKPGSAVQLTEDGMLPYDEELISAFEEAKKNKSLLNLFNSIKNKRINNEDAIEAFVENFAAGMEQAEILGEANQKLQAISIEFDYEPLASLLAYSKADYPLLTEPAYIKAYGNQVLLSVECISFEEQWSELFELHELMDELMIDLLMDSELYKALSRKVTYSSYLLLNRALGQTNFHKTLPLGFDSPLMVYANEHDMETISIFVLEES